MSETITDIVRDIRRRNHGWPLDAEASHSTVEDLLHLADRIEAAHKRELYEAESMEEIEVDRWTSSRCN